MRTRYRAFLYYRRPRAAVRAAGGTDGCSRTPALDAGPMRRTYAGASVEPGPDGYADLMLQSSPRILTCKAGFGAPSSHFRRLPAVRERPPAGSSSCEDFPGPLYPAALLRGDI